MKLIEGDPKEIHSNKRRSELQQLRSKANGDPVKAKEIRVQAKEVDSKNFPK